MMAQVITKLVILLGQNPSLYVNYSIYDKTQHFKMGKLPARPCKFSELCFDYYLIRLVLIVRISNDWHFQNAD